MYNDFVFFFSEGWHHILSAGALDHMLFIAALAVVHAIGAWRRVLLLVTAFTVGHALTLALSVTEVLRFHEGWVEFLIPCTILVTGLSNAGQALRTAPEAASGGLRLSYAFALVFGLVHGMGYANAIRFEIADGQSFAWSLFSFNLGLEAGQIFVVLAVLLTGHAALRIPGVGRRRWVLATSLPISAFALYMALGRLPF